MLELSSRAVYIYLHRAIGEYCVEKVDSYQLVNELLKCAAIMDSENRHTITTMLPFDIRNAIRYHSSAKVHVFNIVSACQNFPNGLDKLIEAVEFFERNSDQFKEVKALLRRSSITPVDSSSKTERFDDTTIETSLAANTVISGPDAASDWKALREDSYNRNNLCLIAVQNYMKWKKLQFPIQNAQTLHETLTAHYTFNPDKTVFLRDPTRREIFHQLAELEQTLTEKDHLILFFAGHGAWDGQREQGYWLPCDARTQDKSNWISNSDIADQLRGFKAKHILVISDACFSGSIFEVREAAEAVTISRLYNMISRAAMTSGVKEPVPDRSIFLKYLVKKLVENQQELMLANALFSSLQQAVISNSQTIPQFGAIHNTGHEGGEFLFFRNNRRL